MYFGVGLTLVGPKCMMDTMCMTICLFADCYHDNMNKKDISVNLNYVFILNEEYWNNSETWQMNNKTFLQSIFVCN